MRYDLSDENQLNTFQSAVNFCIINQHEVEFKRIKRGRTINQNRAMHLFFKFISDKLNENGIEYVWRGLKGMTMNMQYNEFIVKEFLWKQIQLQLYGKESTTQLLSSEITEVADVIIKALAEIGISIQFPSFESWANSELIKKYESLHR